MELPLPVQTVLPINSPQVLHLVNATGMKICNENGQRKFGISEELDHHLTRGSEVFCQVPRHICEVQLYPLFQQIGPIRVIRTMMDFSETNRGFCFIRFETEEDAKRAVIKLHKTEIEPGVKIYVKESFDNCRLNIDIKNTGIPLTKGDIFGEMRWVHPEKAVPINLIMRPNSNGLSYIAEYGTHRAAAIARRELLKRKSPIFEHVNWESTRSFNNVQQFRTLYFGRLTPNTNDAAFFDYFRAAVQDCAIINMAKVKIRRVRDFGFMEFATYEEAEAALHLLSGAVLDNRYLTINWARTRRPQKRQNLQYNNNNDYRQPQYQGMQTAAAAPAPHYQQVQKTPPQLPLQYSPVQPPFYAGGGGGNLDSQFYYPVNNNWGNQQVPPQQVNYQPYWNNFQPQAEWGYA